jgi:hypothetical protein
VPATSREQTSTDPQKTITLRIRSLVVDAETSFSKLKRDLDAEIYSLGLFIQGGKKILGGCKPL